MLNAGDVIDKNISFNRTPKSAPIGLKKSNRSVGVLSMSLIDITQPPLRIHMNSYIKSTVLSTFKRALLVFLNKDNDRFFSVSLFTPNGFKAPYLSQF